jgi:ketosteroid isomerase-like protein
MAFTGPAEDRLMIRELIEAYADAVNCRDAEAWGALWASDSTWSMPDYPEFGTVRGRETIVKTWVSAMALYPGVVFAATIGAIEVNGSEATARSYTSEVYDDSSGVTKRDRGTYLDRLVKIDGRWYFASRSFRNTHRA